MKALKVFARSRSMRFTQDYLQRESEAPSTAVASVDWWSGDGRPVLYRRGTSDVALVYDILFKPAWKSEYWLPEGLEVSSILDVGGNIGITARYLGHRFPQAQLHTFEPIADNCALLRKNIATTHATVHPYGLAARTGTVEFHMPGAARNQGGYSLGSRSGGPVWRADVRAVAEVLPELRLAKLDLIKIDVEGAEQEILGAFPDEVLSDVAWIYGELHGFGDRAPFAFGVLARLARWFDIEVYKPLRKQNWFFDACNRRLSGRFKGFRRVH